MLRVNKCQINNEGELQQRNKQKRNNEDKKHKRNNEELLVKDTVKVRYNEETPKVSYDKEGKVQEVRKVSRGGIRMRLVEWWRGGWYRKGTWRLSWYLGRVHTWEGGNPAWIDSVTTEKVPQAIALSPRTNKLPRFSLLQPSQRVPRNRPPTTLRFDHSLPGAGLSHNQDMMINLPSKKFFKLPQFINNSDPSPSSANRTPSASSSISPSSNNLITSNSSSHLNPFNNLLSSVSLAPSSSAPSPSPSSSSSSLPFHHHPSGNGFRNPWPSAHSVQSNLSQFVNLPFELTKKSESDSRPIRTLPADLKPYQAISNPTAYPHPVRNRSKSFNSSKLISTWLGHASYLLQFPTRAHQDHLTKQTAQIASQPFRVLFDPMFSIRAGPTQWTGPKRLKPSPCHIQQIPAVDICLISHSHYDHLDFDTIKELHKHQPQIKYYVPLGLKSWFNSIPIPADQVIELDWWESNQIISSSRNRPSSSYSNQSQNIQSDVLFQITCVPAQHSSGRSLLDQNSTLWCGWVVEQIWQTNPESIQPNQPTNFSIDQYSRQLSETNGHPFGHALSKQKRCCVYFAGDTGYRSPHDRDLICPAFQEIGEKFGPIDFSMIPIWRGGSLSFISWAGFRINDPNFLVAHHATPEDGLRIHLDVKSKHSIGIHHSCFIGDETESVECLNQLRKYRKLYGIEEDPRLFNGFGVVDVGETVEIEC
ncbi:hypothetical protein O181_028668 [Austropuccinia psidii MF-1]|uniref:Metallo-beta-lactamase domain-containing protein n=1 Tax=Austropuccinia psidii MF-1 TaxID=1389203 RepID=A0A9Q3CU94_9BASI|nr:hypothetical protein [Austropuccinia psidii MF-1]